MLHTTQAEMLECMLENPDEMFVTSISKHCGMYCRQDDAFLFFDVDFSGTPEECEAEMRRILDTNQTTN